MLNGVPAETTQTAPAPINMTRKEAMRKLKEIEAKHRKEADPLESIFVINGKLQLSPTGMVQYLERTFGSCEIAKKYIRVGTKFYYHKDTDFKPVGDVQRRNKKEFLRARTIQRAFSDLVNFEELLFKVVERDEKKARDANKSEDPRDIPGSMTTKQPEQL